MPFSKLAGTALLAAALGLAATASAAAPDRGGWVELDSGRLGAYSWNVSASKAQGSEASSDAPRRACIRVGAMWRTGPLSFLRQRYRACAPSGLPDRDLPPIIASAVQPSNGAPAEMTAVAILAPRAARAVTVTSAPGSSRTIPLHPLEPRQARATNLQRFRYASLVVRGAWCVERVVTRASGGSALWDSGPPLYPCDPS